MFRLTGQFEGNSEAGWLNVTESFSPSADDIDTLKDMSMGLYLSLHGPSPEISSLITGSPARHTKLLDKFLQLRELLPEKPVGLAMVVHKGNIDSIERMTELAAKWRVDFLEFLNLLILGRADACLRKYAMDDSDMRRALKIISSLARTAPVEMQLDYTWGPSEHLISFGSLAPRAMDRRCSMHAPPAGRRYCNAGINHVGLRLDNLKLYPCPGMTLYDSLSCGQYKDGELIINNPWTESLSPGAPCSECSEKRVCLGGCRCAAIADGLRLTGRLDPSFGQASCARSLILPGA
jgi:radical SAM protein with 4Fe4S-binding SPASM domain